MKTLQNIQEDKQVLEYKIQRAIEKFLSDNPRMKPDIDIRLLDVQCKGSGPEWLAEVKVNVTI